VADLSTDSPSPTENDGADVAALAQPGIEPTSRRSELWHVIKQMWQELHDDDLFDAAAGVAFWLILSVPAALLAVLSSVALLGDDLTADLQASVNEFVDRTFTTESETIRTAVDGLFDQGRPGVLSLSVVIAVFTLSRGFAGLIRALDIAYDVDDGRRFIRLRATAIAMALGTIATIAGTTLLWVSLRDSGVPGLIRAGIALIILITWAATLFHVGPHHRTPWRYDLPGAVLTAVGWLIVSLGFGTYVRFAGSGNEIVGAAGTALLALTWLWLACLVFLIGAELNEILAQRAGVVNAPKDFGINVRGRVEDRVRTWRRQGSDEQP
jgi:membrane protein